MRLMLAHVGPLAGWCRYRRRSRVAGGGSAATDASPFRLEGSVLSAEVQQAIDIILDHYWSGGPSKAATGYRPSRGGAASGALSKKELDELIDL